MIRLSVSSICYLRNVFPSDCFSSRDYAGLKVHQIECAEKGEDGELKVKHQDAFLLTQWLERGVFEALAKEYLKTLTFAVYTKDSFGMDILIETYAFAFEYPAGAPAKINGLDMDRDSMKKQAVSFIRCLVEFAGTLEELPDDKWLTLKLTYYDNTTPADYEPHFFTAAQSNILQFDKSVLKVKIGKIETPSHTLNLKFAGVDNINNSFEAPAETLSLLEHSATSGEKTSARLVDGDSSTRSSNIGYSKSLVRHRMTSKTGNTVENLDISSINFEKGCKTPPKILKRGLKKADRSDEVIMEEAAQMKEDMITSCVKNSVPDEKMIETVKEYM